MSEQKKYDVPEVLAALEAAVTERGADYVYEQPINEEGYAKGCFYVHDRETENPTPGCIAGQVYYDLTGKLVPATLEVGLVDDGPTDEWVEEGSFTPAAIRVLGEAQVLQDRGGPWGAALAAAKEKAAEV